MTFRIASVCSILCAALALSASPAAADDLAEAESHFNTAQALYQQGKYEEAAGEFKSAYQARALPPFLFNIGASYEKLAKANPSEINHWKEAIKYYKQYVKNAPEADDRKATKKRIKVLEGELKRLEKEVKKAREPKAVKASDKVKKLKDAVIRGLVVIESEPAGASIYLDDKKNGPVAKTPWSSSLEGEHTIYLVRQGYREYEMTIAPSPDKLMVIKAALAQQDFLGWLEITSNVPGASVYLDDKSVGVYTRTPFSGNLKPGKHKIWVTADGYDEFYQEVEVVAGETQSINVTLKGSPVGYVSVSGSNVDGAKVYLDGKVLCSSPCRKPVAQGKHRLTVKRSGYKPYSRTINVPAKQELTLRVDLAKNPGRGDAVWAYVFAGLFAGGGVALSMQSEQLYDELSTELLIGRPPIDRNDPRFLRGKLFAGGGLALYGLAGITALTAVYYTFRTKGPPSKGALDTRAVSLQPQLGKTYAGLGMEVSF